MRALLIVGLAAAVTFASQALAQGTGGGTGGSTAGTAGAGRGTSSPSTAVPVQPQSPSTGQTNPSDPRPRGNPALAPAAVANPAGRMFPSPI
jgi:hypothetical protein